MKKYLPLFISGILMVFIGLYMILRPDSFLSVVISVFGIYLVFDGMRTLLAAYRLKDVFGKRIRGISMGKALLNMVSGIIVIIISLTKPSLIPTLIVYIAATAFVITGIVDVIDLLILSRAGMGVNALALETILSFVFAIILYLFPNFLTGIVMTLFAAILFASGLLMIYGAISSMVYTRKMRKQ